MRPRDPAARRADPPAGRSVVVLTDPSAGRAVRALLRDYVGDRVVVLGVGGLPYLGCPTAGTHRVDRLHDVVDRLVRLGAQHCLVLALGPDGLARLGDDHGGIFQHLFLHLRPGGTYMVELDVGHLASGRSGSSLKGLDQVLAAAGRPIRGRGRRARRMGVAAYVHAVHHDDGLLVIRKRGRHAVKLREHEVADVLPAREQNVSVSVIARRPSGVLDARAELSSYGPGRDPAWPDRLAYPDMELRHYHGDLLGKRGMVLFSRTTVLPESFRWPHAQILSSPHVDSPTTLHAALPKPSDAPVLPGPHYHLDALFSGHFGHLTTEVVSRLWGWQHARAEVPGLKALFHLNPSRNAVGALERRLFTAFGIRESDLTAVSGPVRLRSVVGASPMWHNHEPYHVHPDIRETWARLSAGILGGAEPAGHERIFVSRGARLRHRRGCRNQDEVERFFADRGYHVFYPEELPLEEQVALFAGARVVAGFAGSAMFNLMHSRRLEAIVVLGHNAYVARNEHLFATVLGAQLHYFWQQSDVPAPPVGRTKASDRSSWAFDFTTYGDALAAVLAGL